MTILSDIRKKLARANTSELAAFEDQPALLEIWHQLQDLREEMNNAKKTAAAEAARPYLETIDVIEKRYALFLRLSS